MGKYYIENRVWYVGYSSIDFDKITSFTDKSIEKRCFTNNQYTESTTADMLYVLYDSNALSDNFLIEHYDPTKTRVEFKFLTNGCVNIVLTFSPDNQNDFKTRIQDMDLDGANDFEKISRDILSLLHPLIQSLHNAKIIKCLDGFLWGIPSLLSKKENGLDLTDIANYAVEANSMHGNETLYWSIIYHQHVLSEVQEDRDVFVAEQEYSIPIPNSKKSIKLAIAYGSSYWDTADLESVKYYLEIDCIVLSKIILLQTSIKFNTELSILLLQNDAIRNDATILELRRPIALIRAHLQCIEMYQPLFSKEANQFYGIRKNFEFDRIRELIHIQKESEDTVLQVATAIEVNDSQIREENLQFAVTVLSALTVFSVLQDVSSFVSENQTLDFFNSRTIIIILIALILYIWVRKYFPNKKIISAKNILLDRFKSIIKFGVSRSN